jgi:NTE family protein
MATRISLVLGSGGARGLAHIGVIRELETSGFEICSIVGCSMGALIGGFHAAGQLATYEAWVRELREWDILRFLDVSFSAKPGMMKGDLLMSKLRELVGDHRIEDLPIGFKAVATDIQQRREVWLGSGDLFAAIRASIAVPGIFTPQQIGPRTLVDGGLLNPLPVAPATEDGTDLTIAVSLAGRPVATPYGPDYADAERRPLEGYRKKIDDFIGWAQASLGVERDGRDNERLGMSDVLIAAYWTMQEAIARFRLASYPPDILIEIPANTCDAHEFYKAGPVIEAGRYWTRCTLDARESHAVEVKSRGPN